MLYSSISVAIANVSPSDRNRLTANGFAGGAAQSAARADAAGEQANAAQYVEQQLLHVQSLSQMRAALASWWTLAFRNGKRERRVPFLFTFEFTYLLLNFIKLHSIAFELFRVVRK